MTWHFTAVVMSLQWGEGGTFHQSSSTVWLQSQRLAGREPDNAVTHSYWVCFLLKTCTCKKGSNSSTQDVMSEGRVEGAGIGDSSWMSGDGDGPIRRSCSGSRFCPSLYALALGRAGTPAPGTSCHIKEVGHRLYKHKQTHTQTNHCKKKWFKKYIIVAWIPTIPSLKSYHNVSGVSKSVCVCVWEKERER